MTSEFFSTLASRNAILYWLGCSFFIAAVISIILLLTTKRKVLGVNAWLKPTKFFVSTGIFAWTMAWLLGYLPQSSTIISYTWVVVAVLVFENVYIAIKAAMGQLSHFNISTPFNGVMFGLMGIAISIMTVFTAYIGWLFFVEPLPNLSPAYLWAIRLGIAIFVIFAFEGGIMGSKLSHTVGAPDGGEGMPITYWSKHHGDLRIAHFVGMHALQLLPLLAYYIIDNVTIILLVGAAYFLLSIWLLVRALKGKGWGLVGAAV